MLLRKLVIALICTAASFFCAVSVSYASYGNVPLGSRTFMIAHDVDVAASSRLFDEAIQKQSAQIADIQRLLDTQFKAYRNKPRDLATWVYHASKLNGLPPRLLVNLMAVESGFNPKAKSRAGARGITQIMPVWGYSPRHLFDYRVATHAGAEIISHYLKLPQCSGNLQCALHSYNVGEYNYRKGKRNYSYVSKLLRGVPV